MSRVTPRVVSTPLYECCHTVSMSKPKFSYFLLKSEGKKIKERKKNLSQIRTQYKYKLDQQ